MDIGGHTAGILVVLLWVASMDTSLEPLCDPFPGAMGLVAKVAFRVEAFSYL